MEDEHLEFSLFKSSRLVIFLRVGTGFGCLEEKPPANRRGVVNSTPTNTARTVYDHIASREHAWLKSWKAQDCTSSVSLKQLSFTCRVPFLAAHTRTMILHPHLPCDVPRQSGGSTQNSISHIIFEFVLHSHQLPVLHVALLAMLA